MVDLASNTASLDDVIQRTTPTAPAPKADPLFDDLVKQAGALRKDTEATSASLAEGAKAKLSIADQISKLRPPEPPKLDPPAKPPSEAPETNPLQAFGSPASWLAIFGGLLTRRPLQTSLDASAAAMNAYRQRDLEGYDQHLKTWKTQSDYAQKTQEYQQALYRDAMASHKGNIDQLLSSLNMIASANQDTIAQHTLKTGDFALFEKLYHDREHQVERFATHREALGRDAETHRHNLQMENTPERNAVAKYDLEHPNATAEEKARFLQTLRKSGNAALKPEQIAFSRWLTEHPEATGEDMMRALNEFKAATGKQTPQTMAVQRYLQENPEASAEDLQRFIVGFKEDAPGVGARKDEKLAQGARKLDIDEAAKKRADELKGKGLDLKEAQIAAQAGHWANQDELGGRKADQGDVKLGQGERKLDQGDRRLGQGDRKLDQIDEKILNDREVQADKLELKARGLSLAEANAVALERWRERQGDLRERTVDVSFNRVMNDALFKEEELALRARGLSQAKARDEALERYRDRALVVRQEVSGAKREQAVKQTDKLIAQGDGLLQMIEQNPNVVGGRGIIAGGVQTLKGMISPRAKVDESYQQFETAMKAWRTEVNLAISQSKYYSSARMAEMAKTLPGLERFQSAQDARTAIETMRGLLAGAKLELGEAPAAAANDVSQADLEFTAEKYGIPVAKVKEQLGLK